MAIGPGDCSIHHIHVDVVLIAFLANVTTESCTMIGRPKDTRLLQWRWRHFPLQSQAHRFAWRFLIISLTLNPTLLCEIKQNVTHRINNGSPSAIQCHNTFEMLFGSYFVRYVRSINPFEMFICLQFAAQPINRLWRIVQFVAQIGDDKSLLFGRRHCRQFTMKAGTYLLGRHPIDFRIRHKQIARPIVRLQSIIRTLASG